MVKSLLYPHCMGFQCAFIASLLRCIVLTHQIVCQKSPEALSLWHCSIANIMAACHSQTRLIFPHWSSGKSPLRHAPCPFSEGNPSHPLPIFGQEPSKSAHGGESSCRRRWAVGGASSEQNDIKAGRGIPVNESTETRTWSKPNWKGIPKQDC